MSDDLEDARIRLAILRMQSEVKATVERDLFKYYRNLGSIIIAVLASVGIFIGWPALVGLVKAEIRDQVDKPVVAAKDTAEKARNIAEGILLRLEEKQVRLQESMGRSDLKFEEMNSHYGRTAAEIRKVDESILDIRKLVDFLKTTTSPQVVSFEQIRNIESQLKGLSDITAQLALRVEAISSTEQEKTQAAEINQSLTTFSAEQAKAIGASQQAQDNPRQNRVVYVQFAGGQRTKIEAIANSLRSTGWSIPGEERRSSAAGKYEVRYFDQGDKTAAEKLAQDTNDAASGLGLRIAKVAAILVNLEKKAAPGIVELWLEIPPN